MMKKKVYGIINAMFIQENIIYTECKHSFQLYNCTIDWKFVVV